MAAKANSTVQPRTPRKSTKAKAPETVAAITIPILDDEHHFELQNLFRAAEDVARSICAVAPLVEQYEPGIAKNDGTVAPEAVAAMATRIGEHLREIQSRLSDFGVMNEGRDDLVSGEQEPAPVVEEDHAESSAIKGRRAAHVQTSALNADADEALLGAVTQALASVNSALEISAELLGGALAARSPISLFVSVLEAAMKHAASLLDGYMESDTGSEDEERAYANDACIALYNIAELRPDGIDSASARVKARLHAIRALCRSAAETLDRAFDLGWECAPTREAA